MAYALGNNCAKNLCKRTVLLQFIIKSVVTCFFLEHSVYIYIYTQQHTAPIGKQCCSISYTNYSYAYQHYMHVIMPRP